uniref:Uncharacterized protein n=1 Tax=Phocoena sinus TaxID=42100 RepID=A0A8C9CDW4_PHOSS
RFPPPRTAQHCPLRPGCPLGVAAVPKLCKEFGLLGLRLVPWLGWGGKLLDRMTRPRRLRDWAPTVVSKSPSYTFHEGLSPALQALLPQHPASVTQTTCFRWPCHRSPC